jgi:peptidoglycan/LPS O-acetylase OafA/YrhL
MSLQGVKQQDVLPTAPHDRMYGLDLCRTVAVLLVVCGHMLQHSQPNAWLASMGFAGLFGVDLFFCLSGFLIGRILLIDASRWPSERQAGLYRFWYRRWMRTLPLYLFFFLVSLRFDWTGSSDLWSRVSYLVFAQNFLWPMPAFFGLTWSLAVEEWFYFSFPLLVMLALAVGRSPKQAMRLAVAVFILVPPLVRFALTSGPHGFGSLDEGVRHVTLFRLDSIGYGVLMACVSQWRPELFARLGRLYWVFGGLVLACMVSTKFDHFGWSSSRILAAVYFSVSGLGFAGLIPFFHGLASPRSKAVSLFVRYTSLISYSMYLAHIFAFMSVMTLLHKAGLYGSIYPNPWLIYPLFFLAVYALSTLTYLGIEKPALALRDKKPPI